MFVFLQNYRPKTKTGHVAPGIPLQRVKTRLNQVKGALVECPLVRTMYKKLFLHFLTYCVFL